MTADRPATGPEPCPICGGCQADDRQLQTLNDREEACKLLTGLLDAFDARWSGDKPPPPVYYRAQHFLDRMLPERIGAKP